MGALFYINKLNLSLLCTASPIFLCYEHTKRTCCHLCHTQSFSHIKEHVFHYNTDV